MSWDFLEKKEASYSDHGSDIPSGPLGFLYITKWYQKFVALLTQYK